MLYNCERCRHDLYGKPKIDIEGRIYCYRCSKIENIEIRKLKIANFQKGPVYQEYNEKKLKYEKELFSWERKKAELTIKTNNSWYFLGVFAIGSILRSLWKGKLMITGDTTVDIILVIVFLIIVVAISSNRDDKKEREFSLSNPKPTFLLKEPRTNISAIFHLMPNDGSQVKPEEYPLSIYNRDNYTCQKCRKEKDLGDLRVKELIPNSNDKIIDPTTMITICSECLGDKDIGKFKFKVEKR